MAKGSGGMYGKKGGGGSMGKGKKGSVSVKTPAAQGFTKK